MLERVQERSWLRMPGSEYGVRLSGAQKVLSQWAIVDDYNAVLDMRCTDTALLRSLSQKFSLRTCGIAENAAEAHALRDRIPNAEIFCARREDIPWQDRSFDAVFYSLKKNEGMGSVDFLKEAMRVLRPRGQLLIAIQGLPEFFCGIADFMGAEGMDERVRPGELLKAMEDAGFQDISYRISRPTVGLAMGWKNA